jgi:hypothetical protein
LKEESTRKHRRRREGRKLSKRNGAEKKKLGSVVTEKINRNEAAHQVAFQEAERSAGWKSDPVGYFYSLLHYD